MSITEEYSNNFWQLGNLITGFAIAYAMLAIFYISSAIAHNLIEHRPAAIGFTVWFYLVFAVAVCLCHRAELSLLPAQDRTAITSMSRAALFGRIFALILFAGLLLWVIVEARA